MTLPKFQLYVDGAFIDAAETFLSLDPSTGEPWAEMPKASVEETCRAVEAAYRALTGGAWPSFTATERGKLLARLADLVAANADRLAELETKDTGKIIRETRAQVGYVAEYYRYFAGLADKVQGAHLPIDKPDMEVTVRREPIGVVAAVVPWNSQMFLAAVKLAPALAAGCTVVLKASEDGPAPLLEFARLVEAAGTPAGVVNVVTGFGEDCGRALTSHPLVSRVAFTGGPATARQVVRNTAENFAHTTLELGGKSPVLVFADADLASVTNSVVAGIYAASGQSCVAGSRLYVQRSVHDRLVDAIAAKARAIVIGDPSNPATEMGPLATKRQVDGIEAVVERSVGEGARIVTGGKRPKRFASGFYFEPTLIACADAAVTCVQEELFGPVLSVIPFEDEADALVKANDSRYALACGLFTRDLARTHRLVRSVRSGIVWVNTYRAVSPMAPFGGYGQSGYGREGGLESILDYTRTKTVWIRTSDDPIPDPFVMR